MKVIVGEAINRGIPYGNGLLRITARHFCAGVIVQAGWVSHQAPILNYMHHWTWRAVVGYCEQKHWRCELIVGGDYVGSKVQPVPELARHSLRRLQRPALLPRQGEDQVGDIRPRSEVRQMLRRIRQRRRTC